MKFPCHEEMMDKLWQIKNEMALKWLMPLKRKFKRDPELQERYTEQMKAMLEKGCAEVVDESERTELSFKTCTFPTMQS